MKFFLISLFLLSSLFGQDESDAIRPFLQEIGPGARAMALGGAYVALAEDYTAAYWNPAGLAQIRRIEFHTGISHENSKSRIAYQSVTTSNSTGFTNLNSIGAVFPIPTYRGSLVFAIGYHRVNLFDNFSQIIGRPIISGKSFNQDERSSEEGTINNWSFSGAVDLTKNLSVGGTLNLITGGNDINVRYVEDDPLDVLTTKSFNGQFRIRPDYTGVNFKAGALIRPMPNARIGLTLTTPSSLGVEENSNYSEVSIDDNNASSEYREESFLKYRITSPWKLEIGASYKYQLITTTASVEYVDWTQMRFHSNILDNGIPIDADIDDAFLTQFRAATSYRLGIEGAIPNYGLKLMLGYAYHESPYKPTVELINSNKQYFSGGVSFLIDEQIKLDFACQYRWWRQASTDSFLGEDVSGKAYTTSERIGSTRFLMSMSYRF